MNAARYLGSFLCLLTLTALATAQGKLVNDAPGSDSKSDTTSSQSSRYELPPPPDKVGGKDIDEWIRDLSSEDPSVRSIAVTNIAAFRENAGRAVPAVIGRLRDGDVAVRAKAAILFRYLPKGGVRETDVSRVVKALAERLSPGAESQAIVRYEAASTLGQRFAGQNREACQALIRGTNDGSCWEFRQACVVALWQAGWDPKNGPNPDATRALLNCLKHDHAHGVKLEALKGLGGMGRPQSPHLLAEVVDNLLTWTRARNVTSRLWANVSLVMLGDNKQREKKALDAIAATLKDRERENRVAGIQALGILGERGRDKLGDVIDMLSDADEEVVAAAAGSLPMMNDKSQRVLRPLIDLTKGGKDRRRVIGAACVALQRIGKPDPDVVKAMESVANRDELPKEMRTAVKEALQELMTPKNEKRGAPAPLVQPVPVDAPQQARPDRRGRD